MRPAAGTHLVTVPFRLTRTARLDVAVTGEAGQEEGGALDFGWIEDARTGRTVWTAEQASARPAGNARDNVRWEETLALNAGDYLAGFLSDAAHGPDDSLESARPSRPTTGACGWRRSPPMPMRW